MPEAVQAPEPAAAPTIRDDLLEHLAQFPISAKPNRAARRRAARGVATALALALLTSTAIPPRAQALTVFDPANYQQNLLSAARALEQINTQVRALQNQAQIILRMDQNLTRLGGTLSPDLQRTLTGIQTQLHAGQGIALKLQQTQSTYERLFPAQVSTALALNDVLRNAKTRWDEEYAGLKRAALLQGQIADGIETDTRLLGDAMTRSRNAAGALDATQAGNELTGLAVKQSLALQGLLAAQHRAETVSRARNLATEDEARQRFKSFVGTGSGYSGSR
jgi:P-type conjugative transfer protein TrbJ